VRHKKKFEKNDGKCVLFPPPLRGHAFGRATVGLGRRLSPPKNTFLPPPPDSPRTAENPRGRAIYGGSADYYLE